MFNKEITLFPIKKKYKYFSHCGISPLWSKASDSAIDIIHKQQNDGFFVFKDSYDEILEKLHIAFGKILLTDKNNISFLKNTSEGMSMIANGYPFQIGDQVISYVHEYPANYYPWKLQEQRGAELKLLPNKGYSKEIPQTFPIKWLIDDLQKQISPKTKVVSISHVQFTSGFACDLKIVGEICKTHNLDLIVDAAQSLGCLPLLPEEWHISAIVSSGWKWLLGPIGCGVMYTSPEFRRKIADISTGAELMVQGLDYLDHSWAPHTSAKRFEYSTSPICLATALVECARLNLRYGSEKIKNEVFRLQNYLIQKLDTTKYIPILFPNNHRSGILSIFPINHKSEYICEILLQKNIITSSQGGFLRIAPHFYNTEDEINYLANELNALSV